MLAFAVGAGRGHSPLFFGADTVTASKESTMTTPEITPISGKDIVILDPPPPQTLEQRLQGLLSELGDGCSKHDQVRVLIAACISEGVSKGTDIIATVAALGFDRSHVGMWLAKDCGSNAQLHHWFKDGDEQYRLHG